MGLLPPRSTNQIGLVPDVPVISKDYGFVYKGAF